MKWIACSVAALALSVPAALQSQLPYPKTLESNDSRALAACQVAAPVLLAGQPGAAYDSALAIIQVCDQSGGPAIAAVWNQAGGPTNIEQLARISQGLRDARILDAVVRAAKRTTLPDNVRLTALRVLANYGDSNSTVSLKELQIAPDPPFGSMGGSTHSTGVQSASPLPTNTADSVARVLWQLAKNDPSPDVRRAARWLRYAFSLVRSDVTPIAISDVHLFYQCGNSFRVRNAADLSVGLRWVVEGDPPGAIAVDAPDPGQSYKDYFFSTGHAGTVRLYYNQQLIQTVANGNTACQ